MTATVRRFDSKGNVVREKQIKNLGWLLRYRNEVVRIELYGRHETNPDNICLIVTLDINDCKHIGVWRFASYYTMAKFVNSRRTWRAIPTYFR